MAPFIETNGLAETDERPVPGHSLDLTVLGMNSGTSMVRKCLVLSCIVQNAADWETGRH